MENYNYIWYTWNIFALIFGYAILGLTWWPLIFFMLFVNAVMIRLFMEIRELQLAVLAFKTAQKNTKSKPKSKQSKDRPVTRTMRLFDLQWGYTQAQVNSAYRKLAKKYHPDLHGGDDSKIKQVNLAKEWLDQQIKTGLNV